MTPLSFSVLRILSDGKFHSGEEIANSLSVSRGSVWNAAASIEEAGIALDRVKGRGYRMVKPFEWLEKSAILSDLGENAYHFDIEILDTVDSTNSYLLREDAPSGRVAAAEEQTKGRGRMGRTWASTLGGSLTFSLAWEFNRGAGALSGLSLAVGAALVRAFDSLGFEGACLKWPNDILHQFQKISGILIEMEGDVLGPSKAVIGIGVNCSLSKKTKDEIDQAATDFHTINKTGISRNALFSAILRELFSALRTFEKEGFEAFREDWTKRNCHQGREVTLKLPDGKVMEGKVLGVNEKGELLLSTGQGTLNFHSGELRFKGGYA